MGVGVGVGVADDVVTVVSTVAVLLVLTGSVSSADTLPKAVTVPDCVGVTWIVPVAWAPMLSVPKLKVPMPFKKSKVPRLEVAELKITPVGKMIWN